MIVSSAVYDTCHRKIAKRRKVAMGRPMSSFLRFCGLSRLCGDNFELRILAGSLLLWGLLAATLMGGAAAATSAEGEASEQSALGGYDSKGRRDPFSPLVREGRLLGTTPGGARGDGSRPALYGILWDPGGHSIALINDGEAKVGDLVEGYKVADIRKDAVVLTSEGGESVVLQISFDAPSIKPPPHGGATTGGEDR